MRGRILPIRPLGILGATALILVCLFSFPPGEADAASSYIDFDRHDSRSQLASGVEKGMVIEKSAVKLAKGKKSGTLTSKVYSSATTFDTLLPSWNAVTPKGTYMRTEVRVQSGSGWTRWWNMGLWASGTDTVRRQSLDGQRYGSWRVATDTLTSGGSAFANAYQYRITLATKKVRRSPKVDSLSFTASDSRRHGNFLV